jgi:hypothetical protein
VADIEQQGVIQSVLQGQSALVQPHGWPPSSCSADASMQHRPRAGHRANIVRGESVVPR